MDHTPYGRRAFLNRAGLGLTAAALGAGLVAEVADAAGPAEPAVTAAEGLARLMAGNRRFVADRAHCPPLTARRLELQNGQSPFAVILSCSDSRVPVETVFDQEPGNVFGVRIAGNFITDEGLGSIEYAIAELKSSLILALGHSGCGAVKAAVTYVKDGTTVPGHIQDLVVAIAPAARATKARSGDWVANAVVQNVKDTVSALTARSKIVADAVQSEKLTIAGGVYDLHSGKVSIIH